MPLHPMPSPGPVYQRRLGFIDRTGALVVPQVYAFSLHSEFNVAGYCIVHTPEGATCVIDVHGTQVLTLPKHHRVPFNTPPDAMGIFPVESWPDEDDPNQWEIQGRDRVYLGRRFFYAMRLSGEVAFEAKITAGAQGYYQLDGMPEDTRKRTLGIIDHRGEVIVQPQFEWMQWSRTDPVITVVRDGKCGVIDYLGNEVVPIDVPVRGFVDVREVKDGMFVFHDRQAKTCPVMTLDGEVLSRLPTTYWSPLYPDACPTLSNGLAQITLHDRSRYFVDAYGTPQMQDPSGHKRVFSKAEQVGYFYDGRATYRVNEQSGFIDSTGAEVIPRRFASAADFRGGLARVHLKPGDYQDGRLSYVDVDGQEVARND